MLPAARDAAFRFYVSRRCIPTRVPSEIVGTRVRNGLPETEIREASLARMNVEKLQPTDAYISGAFSSEGKKIRLNNITVLDENLTRSQTQDAKHNLG